jgi:hypothetical protein
MIYSWSKKIRAVEQPLIIHDFAAVVGSQPVPTGDFNPAEKTGELQGDGNALPALRKPPWPIRSQQ